MVVKCSVVKLVFDMCISDTTQPSTVALYLYDAVYLYLMTVHRMIVNGSDYRRGSLVLQKAEGIHFYGKRFVSITKRSEDQQKCSPYE